LINATAVMSSLSESWLAEYAAERFQKIEGDERRCAVSGPDTQRHGREAAHRRGARHYAIDGRASIYAPPTTASSSTNTGLCGVPATSGGAKAQEGVDLEAAARQYRRALSKSIEAETFSTSRSIFPGDDPDNRHLRVLDRLTLCLVRCGCSSEAAEEAAAYFAKFPTLRSTKVGLAITKRIEKAGRVLFARRGFNEK
jgi:hypothetical protein